MYKVSVIIPIYNMEKYLRECLDSVLGQTMKEIEIICVDDGSNDGTMNILNEYKRRNQNVVIVQQRRRGPSSARNKGIKIARGEFVAFLDADDLYVSNDVLEYLYSGVKTNQVNMGGGSLLLLTEGKIKKHPENKMYISEPEHIEYSKDYQYSSGFTRFLYRKDFLENNNIFFRDIVCLEDPVFLMDALIASEKIWLTPKEVYLYRQVDKKREFTSVKVISDIMNGYAYMMQKTQKCQYQEMQDLLLQRIMQLEDALVMQICNGHYEIYNLLRMIGNNIIDDNKRTLFLTYWTIEEIEKRLCEKQEKIGHVRSCIESYEGVIIYGAGNYGRRMYDYIETIDGICFWGFAVTEEHPMGTARGYEIRPLSDYKEFSEKALVIVAIKNDVNCEMQEYAKKLGFKNILYINENISYVGINRVTEGKFLFDNT